MKAKGVLLDIQGVLLEEGRLIDGAAEAVRWLGERGLRYRFLTNVTTRSHRAIADKLREVGCDATDEQVFSPPVAAGAALRKLECERVLLAADDKLREDFAGFSLVDDGADAVVLGDLQEGFTWRRLNQLFREVERGAHLVALHKNRYCRRDGEIALDLGPFVAALEYAAAVEAKVVGKPSAAFFEMALEALELQPDDVVMVGDDLEADVGGAQNAGIRGVQVRTGKYQESDDRHSSVRPAERIDSIADLPRIVGAS